MAKSKSSSLLLNQAIASADALALRHDDYVDQFVARAHTELYAMLADMMQCCLDVAASPLCDAVLKKMRLDLKEKHGMRVSAKTPVVAVVIKYITRTNRKTVHIYKRVIETAIEQHVCPGALPEFIASAGGIEKVRRAVATKTEQAAAKQGLDAAYEHLSKKLLQRSALGTVQFSAPPSLPHGSDVTYTHLLCIENHKTKQLEVVASLYPSSFLEQRAFYEYTLALRAAAKAGSQGFKEHCKENGLQDDIVLRWMTSNGVCDAATAKAYFGELSIAAKSVDTASMS